MSGVPTAFDEVYGGYASGSGQKGGDAQQNTGGGGGAGSTGYGAGGNGGSGIIIIRYLSTSTSTSTSLELVRGTTTDGEVDYSVGNYDGVFKVKSIDAGTTTDRMTISSAGNVGIGTTSHGTYKLDVNGDINISSGSQFRITGNVLSTFTPSSTNLIGPFLDTQFENVGGFIQYKTNGISYNNLTNKLTVLAGGNITISGTNEISSAMFAPSSTNLISVFNTPDDFVVNGAKIELTKNTSNYVLSTSNILVKRITDEVGYTSNYVERLTTELGTNYWTSDSGSGATNIYLNQAGNVGIGTQTSLTNKLQVQGNCAITGNLGIGVVPHSTHDLDVLGTGRISGGLTTDTIYAVGLIAGNAGITVPSGQTLTSVGTLTTSVINASGLIKGNTGITVSSGQTLTSAGTLTASVINASGLIAGNGGITVPSGQTLSSEGTLTASVINASGLITVTNTTTGTSDSLIMRYDTRNGIRIQQRYIGVDNVGYDLNRKLLILIRPHH